MVTGSGLNYFLTSINLRTFMPQYYKNKKPLS
jgi:hypothetical protein